MFATVALGVMQIMSFVAMVCLTSSVIRIVWVRREIIFSEASVV